MNDPAIIPAVHVQEDAAYLPLPNRVELVLTDVLPPDELTPTSFVIGISEDGGVVMADHARRGVEITGGHREPGETAEQTARREGGEESGARYLTLWPIGYLRCTSKGTVPHDHPYPHPIGYQAIHAASVVGMERREDYLECREPVVLASAGIDDLPDPLRSRLRLLHAAALSATGRDRTIDELAQEARPTDDGDWASQRRMDAENRFVDECRRLDPMAFGDDGEFQRWCLKATADEMIDEALRILRETTRR